MAGKALRMRIRGSINTSGWAFRWRIRKPPICVFRCCCKCRLRFVFCRVSRCSDRLIYPNGWPYAHSMVATKHREELVYAAVEAGELQIRPDGTIWRLASRGGVKGKPGVTILRKHMPRRAEHTVPKGYMQVRVMWNGKRTYALAHRLVWRHSNGQIPGGLTVNHKNGRKSDNRLENLELATQREQILHSVHVLGTARAANQKGEANHAAKLTRLQVVEIRKRRRMGETYAMIAGDYGVTYQAVHKIITGQRWRGQ